MRYDVAMHIPAQLEEIRQELAEAESVAQRAAGSVQLLAVSKTFPVSDIRQAYDCGQRLFGENRLQEALEKMPQMPSDCRWHLIGPLQRNKVRKALQAGFELIQAVDSLRLAEFMNRVAEEEAVCPAILLEVNVDGEASKHGFSPDELLEQWEQLTALTQIKIEGLMCIPAIQECEEDVRAAFARLRDLTEQLRQRGPLPLPQISMGMSSDFAAAIAEGATLVRVGSAIFGKRDYGHL